MPYTKSELKDLIKRAVQECYHKDTQAILLPEVDRLYERDENASLSEDNPRETTGDIPGA